MPMTSHSPFNEHLDYEGGEHRRKLTRENRKNAHHHELGEVQGNVLRCKCGAVMGFLKDPKKVANR